MSLSSTAGTDDRGRKWDVGFSLFVFCTMFEIKMLKSRSLVPPLVAPFPDNAL